MTQPLWLFCTRLTIIADRTTTGGQYEPIEGYFPPEIMNRTNAGDFYGSL